MHFVDRAAELARLSGLCAAAEGSLVVVWGRRRVGKTRLLLEWVARERGLYWVADESAPGVQRRYLAAVIAERFPGFADVEYPDWASLLVRLAKEAKATGFRGPVVIDELPYAVASSPELPSVLQRLIDHEAKAAGLVIALAGSSQRMMQDLTLSRDAPLYGRAREVFKLEPIPAGHLAAALGLREPRRVVESYACWGGIPRYWELAHAFADTEAAVDAQVLDPRGPLHDEPARLLLEETPSAVALRPLLDAIGAGAHRPSEIAGRVGQPATTLARPLARLQELDLVTRETPFGEPERSGKRSLYKLSDPFLRLWFSIVAPRRSWLLQATPAARRRLLADRFAHLVSITWEGLCRRAIPRLGPRLGLDFGPAQRFWHGQGPEWDAVATVDDALLLGETKWLARDPTAAEIAALVDGLVAKGVPPVGRKAVVHHAVFVPTLPKGARRTHGNVHLVDAAAVLSVLR
jgi:hypothetical protein